MTKKSQELRKRAKKIVELRKDIPDKSLNDLNVDRLIEELSIYQVELELQNEELLKSQDALNSAKDRYEDLFETAPNGYLIVDGDFNITGCNKTFTSILGHRKSQLKNNKLTKYIHPDFQDQVYLNCNELFNKKPIYPEHDDEYLEECFNNLAQKGVDIKKNGLSK